MAPALEAGSGIDTYLLCAEYESFLLKERSLTPSSTEKYIEVARRFLCQRFPTGKIYLKKLRAGSVTDFLLHDSSNRRRKSVQMTATVLRSFLSFLFQKGRIATNLAAVVPSVAHRRLAELPHYLEAREVERVLHSCDRRRKIGNRDYTIFLLLGRLGLRAGEVAQLGLDDIDWRAGELLVRGKGARVDRLPLLEDVSQALANYLQKARPACASRRVFIQCKAPFEGFAGPQCVSNLVRMALIRLDLSPAHRGAHVLRHSASRWLVVAGSGGSARRFSSFSFNGTPGPFNHQA